VKVKRITVGEGGGLWGYSAHCPGCSREHHVPVKPQTYPNGSGWDFSGTEDAPTFSPSLLVHPWDYQDGVPPQVKCHSFIRNGRWEFLSDCEHALAGQTVDMVDIFGDNP